MSDKYDYYPCKIISIEPNQRVKIDNTDKNVNIVKLKVIHPNKENGGSNEPGPVDYYAIKLEKKTKNGKNISLTKKTNPLYLRISNIKSETPPTPSLIWKTSTDRAEF